MNRIITLCSALFGSNLLLLIIHTASLTVKSFIFGNLALIGRRRSTGLKQPLLFLQIVLASTIFLNFTWITRLLELLYFPWLAPTNIILNRLAWALAVTEHQALSLFLSSLVERKRLLGVRHCIFLAVSLLCVLFFLALALFAPPTRSAFEYKALHFTSMYAIFGLGLSSFLTTLWRLRSDSVPRILHKQLSLLLRIIIGPYLLSSCLQVLPYISYGPFAPFAAYRHLTGNTIFSGVSALILTAGLYYAARKVVVLRFLNFQKHVHSPKRLPFIDRFKDILEQLSRTTHEKELFPLTQTFFSQAFSTHPDHVHLHIRHLTTERLSNTPEYREQELILEQFLNEQSFSPITSDEHASIFVKDEIEFNNFYQYHPTLEKIIALLETLNADILLPIYNRQTVVAYIVIECNARSQEFYLSGERAEMLIFANYLSSIINLLQERNFDTLMTKQRELEGDIHKKEQTIRQYRESIKSFLRDNNERKIGIIFYRNNKFIMANQSAHELIPININALEGHPITQTFKKLVSQISAYRTTRSEFANDHVGNKLVISGVPSAEGSHIIFTVHYPELSDLVRKSLDFSQHPSTWDYVLHLETTQSGKLINQLVPGQGEQLLAFKMDLMKIALNNQALLLETPADDIMATVEIIHHISLRTHLEVFDVKQVCKEHDPSIVLFGLNPLLGGSTTSALLERLDKVGTLYIKGVDLLPISTQQALATFIRSGSYKPVQSDKKQVSDVRIITSTVRAWDILVSQEVIAPDLAQELQHTTLTMPNLTELPESEMQELLEGVAKQEMGQEELQKLLYLTNKEKSDLLAKRPLSLHALKNRIRELIAKKSERTPIFHETRFNPAHKISDPELLAAAQLGKSALKNRKVMRFLWDTFKNQNQIATFLGVNRSSVNRRCKQYRLE